MSFLQNDICLKQKLKCIRHQ